jgi:hypothetical protein
VTPPLVFTTAHILIAIIEIAIEKITRPTILFVVEVAGNGYGV